MLFREESHLVQNTNLSWIWNPPINFRATPFHVAGKVSRNDPHFGDILPIPFHFVESSEVDIKKLVANAVPESTNKWWIFWGFPATALVINKTVMPSLSLSVCLSFSKSLQRCIIF